MANVLGAGDIVLFVFPIRLPGETEEPKTRPCLVLDVVEKRGYRFAILAYGTSAASMANKGYEITVATAAEVAACGLRRYTRFVGARRLLVPLNHGDFRPKRSMGSPVIGRLGPAAMARLHEVRGRTHAEADIAAERCAEAWRERRGAQHAHAAGGRGVPVVPRHWSAGGSLPARPPA